MDLAEDAELLSVECLLPFTVSPLISLWLGLFFCFLLFLAVIQCHSYIRYHHHLPSIWPDLRAGAGWIHLHQLLSQGHWIRVGSAADRGPTSGRRGHSSRSPRSAEQRHPASLELKSTPRACQPGSRLRCDLSDQQWKSRCSRCQWRYNDEFIIASITLENKNLYNIGINFNNLFLFLFFTLQLRLIRTILSWTRAAEEVTIITACLGKVTMNTFVGASRYRITTK